MSIEASPSPRLTPVLVWDVPLRLFHWLLVAAVALAFATGLTGGAWLAWHGRLGALVLGLLVFRAGWGVVGSTYARFAQLVPSPSALRAALAGQWRGVGHPPQGALAMLAILGVLAAQAASGLFTSDDIDTEGPLAAMVSQGAVGFAGWVHQWSKWVTLGLVGLHVLAIAYHSMAKKERLVGPMLTGVKQVPDELARAAEGGGLWRFVAVATLAAAMAWGLGSGALAEWAAPSVSSPAPGTPASPPAW